MQTLVFRLEIKMTRSFADMQVDFEKSLDIMKDLAKKKIEREDYCLNRHYTDDTIESTHKLDLYRVDVTATRHSSWWKDFSGSRLSDYYASVLKSDCHDWCLFNEQGDTDICDCSVDGHTIQLKTYRDIDICSSVSLTFVYDHTMKCWVANNLSPYDVDAEGYAVILDFSSYFKK